MWHRVEGRTGRVFRDACGLMMLTMVCAKALSKGNKACSCVRSVNKVAWEAMIHFFFPR